MPGIDPLSSGDGSGVNGLHVLSYCDSLARSLKRSRRGQRLLPSAGRIFYYTRRLLIARGISPEVNPDEVILLESVVQQFFQEAPLVAKRLAADYPRAVQIRAEPGPQLRRILSKGPLLRAPELKCPPEYPVGTCVMVQGIWEHLWEACWRASEQEHLARLRVLSGSHRLPVAPIARLDDDPVTALHSLRGQLALDAALGKAISADAYLYDVPLETWLLESLLTSRWLFRLCQGLAELSRQVVGLVGQRQGIPNGHSTGRNVYAQEESGLGPMLATVPATAEEFFAAAIAWKQALALPDAAPLVPDEQQLSAEQFQEVLTAAVQGVERFLQIASFGNGDPRRA